MPKMLYLWLFPAEFKIKWPRNFAKTRVDAVADSASQARLCFFSSVVCQIEQPSNSRRVRAVPCHGRRVPAMFPCDYASTTWVRCKDSPLYSRKLSLTHTSTHRVATHRPFFQPLWLLASASYRQLPSWPSDQCDLLTPRPSSSHRIENTQSHWQGIWAFGTLSFSSLTY